MNFLSVSHTLARAKRYLQLKLREIETIEVCRTIGIRRVWKTCVYLLHSNQWQDHANAEVLWWLWQVPIQGQNRIYMSKGYSPGWTTCIRIIVTRWKEIEMRKISTLILTNWRVNRWSYKETMLVAVIVWIKLLAKRAGKNT